jgi:Spy/CpxP family protein refolding chaperone
MRVLAGILGAMLSTVAHAQSHPHQQPYAGLEGRLIKALSEQQVADLRDGKGMSLALAAELNGYPGPSHVLEHAEALQLTDGQREKVQDLFRSMQAEARTLGSKLIRQESHLDSLFARHEIDAATLSHMTKAIGETQALLRAAHLKYHLTTAELLTPEQNRRYVELRGYSPRQ